MLITEGEITTALKKAFPNLPDAEISKGVKAIMDATGKWEEVKVSGNLGATMSIQCKDICALGEAHDKGLQIRAFVSRKA